MTIPDFIDTLLYDQENFKKQAENYNIWSEIIFYLGNSGKVTSSKPCIDYFQVSEIIEFLELIDGNGWKAKYDVVHYSNYSRINFSIQRMNI